MTEFESSFKPPMVASARAAKSLAEIEAIADLIDSHFENSLIEATTSPLGEVSFTLKAEQIVPIAYFLRDDSSCRFTQLVDLCGVDYTTLPKRFELVYHLLSLVNNSRLRLRVRVAEDEAVPSVCEVWPTAGWYERECWDMFGIWFADHPDLRRLLTDYGFDGHPLRKDFPLSGYTEARYDHGLQRVVYERVNLAQDFRRFDFESPWHASPQRLHGDEKGGDEKALPPDIEAPSTEASSTEPPSTEASSTEPLSAEQGKNDKLD